MTPLTPVRVLDTRSGLGGISGPVGSEETAVLKLPGASTVPAGKAAAVVLNVTATQPTAGGYLTVFPGGKERPLASNLNFAVGQTVPRLVIVPVDTSGRVQIYNRSGETHVIVDVVGWFDVPVFGIEVDGLSTFGSEVVIDPTSTYAYFSNTANSQVEVLRLADGVLEDPIFVGSQPMGLDLTPDGSLMYVANRGSAFVSVVDVKTRIELRRFAIPTGFSADRPYSIAVLANGTALLTTTFGGSGFGASMYAIDLTTETVVRRSDFYSGGSTTEETSIRASGDRLSAVIAVGDISSGPVFRYDAVTDTFTDEVDTATFISSIATNVDGTVTLSSGMVFDEDLNLTGTVEGSGYSGVAVNGPGTVGYGLGAFYNEGTYTGYMAVCDLDRFQVTDIYAFGVVHDLGRLALSPDGKTLVGITDWGVVLFPLP